MRRLALTLAVLLAGCATREQCEASARRYMAALGVEGKVYCSSSGDCTLATGAGLLALDCDEEDCRLRPERHDSPSPSPVYHAPAPVPQ